MYTSSSSLNTNRGNRLANNFQSHGRQLARVTGQLSHAIYDTRDEWELFFGNREGRITQTKQADHMEMIRTEAVKNRNTERGRFGFTILKYMQGDYKALVKEDWGILQRQIAHYSVPVLRRRALYRGAAIPNEMFNDVVRAYSAFGRNPNNKTGERLKQLSKELLHKARSSSLMGHNPGIGSVTTYYPVADTFMRTAKGQGKTTVMIELTPDDDKPGRGLSMPKSAVSQSEHEVIMDGLSNEYVVLGIERRKLEPRPGLMLSADQPSISTQTGAMLSNMAITALVFGLPISGIKPEHFDYYTVIRIGVTDISERPNETAHETHAQAEARLEPIRRERERLEAERRARAAYLEKFEELQTKINRLTDRTRGQLRTAYEKRPSGGPLAKLQFGYGAYKHDKEVAKSRCQTAQNLQYQARGLRETQDYEKLNELREKYERLQGLYQ